MAGLGPGHLRLVNDVDSRDKPVHDDPVSIPRGLRGAHAGKERPDLAGELLRLLGEV